MTRDKTLDVGLFVPFGRHLSNELKVNICVYDYTVGGVWWSRVCVFA